MVSFLVPPQVRGQDVRFRTVSQQDDGLIIEVTADWDQSLRAVLDSTGISSFSDEAAAALAQGLLEVSETYELPSMTQPTASVLSSEYDEIVLAPKSGFETVAYSGPTAEVVGLGLMRKRPVASLLARLLTYDGSRQTVRRLRQLRVRLTFGGGGSAEAGAFVRAGGFTIRHAAVEQSVLADGVIFKIPIRREGIYRIDRQFIANLPGLPGSPDQIDPNHVRVYGNGGEPLPALNAAPRPADLVENPVLRQGGGDGRFDESDAIYFYAKGPYGWRFNPNSEEWEHYVHPFSSENFYFLKITDADEPKNVGRISFPDFSDAVRVESVIGRHFREFDEFMWSKENGTGLTWFSGTIRAGDRRTIFDNLQLPGFSGGQVTLRTHVAIRSNPRESVHIESGNVHLREIRARGTVGVDVDSPAAISGQDLFSHTLNAGERLNLHMRMDANTEGAPEAAIDWVRVFYEKTLSASGDTLRFTTPPGRTGRFEIVLHGFSGEPHVWDVTEHGQIRQLEVRAEGASYRVQVEATNSVQPRELIAFRLATAATPDVSRAHQVANQNLHGISAAPELVIVTPAELSGSAQTLAEYRRAEGLDVLVADIQQIYNEFSGGLQDMRAVRDYLKFLYELGPGSEPRLRYALFFGDGHYNYRSLGGELQRPTLENWIPPYETENSLDPKVSYTSDDYFGLLDDHEGEWAWMERGTERMDIGVGRFTVQTPDEAAALVAKIKHYENPQTYGAWRSRYLFVADDGHNGTRGSRENQPDLHTQNADVVAALLNENYPQLNVRKIYGISYSREFLNGWRLPGVKRDIQSSLNEGVLVMNYSGHGGEQGLAQEEVFTREDAAALQNMDRLPIFVTATCSFGWWDLGREQSGAEVLLLNPNGGAIALLTTVRLVYTSTSTTSLNVGLNRALTLEMFKTDENGQPRRLGDILLSTKNTSAGLEGNNRKFNLLGDPTLRVGVPARTAAIETVNGEEMASNPQIRALDRVTIRGSVRRPDGEVDGSFSGQVNLTVFDAERRVQIEDRVVMPTPYYTVREDLIWRGVVPATAGGFEATFVVPKDISYSNSPGRITAYVFNGDEQSTGFTEDVIIGGTSANPPPDDEGPAISLFLNDTTFVSGGLTTARPKLIVKLSDESGINTVGAGVGHEVLLVVDGDEQNAVDISNRFESDPNSYRSGRVTFSFDDYPATLEDGPHSLTVRAWDVVNNSSSATLEFVVAAGQDLTIRNVFNYPNPTSGETRFVFEHNQPTGTTADVQVRIYTLAGRPVRTIDDAEALPAGFLMAGPVQVLWDGRDEDLNLVASGVYLYKVRVAVEGADGERHVSERIEKLAVIR